MLFVKTQLEDHLIRTHLITIQEYAEIYLNKEDLEVDKDFQLASTLEITSLLIGASKISMSSKSDDVPPSIIADKVPSITADEVPTPLSADDVPLTKGVRDVQPSINQDDVLPSIDKDDVLLSINQDDVPPSIDRDNVPPSLHGDNAPSLMSLDDVPPSIDKDDVPLSINKDVVPPSIDEDDVPASNYKDDVPPSPKGGESSRPQSQCFMESMNVDGGSLSIVPEEEPPPVINAKPRTRMDSDDKVKEALTLVEDNVLSEGTAEGLESKDSDKLNGKNGKSNRLSKMSGESQESLTNLQKNYISMSKTLNKDSQALVSNGENHVSIRSEERERGFLKDSAVKSQEKCRVVSEDYPPQRFVIPNLMAGSFRLSNLTSKKRKKRETEKPKSFTIDPDWFAPERPKRQRKVRSYADMMMSLDDIDDLHEAGKKGRQRTRVPAEDTTPPTRELQPSKPSKPTQALTRFSQFIPGLRTPGLTAVTQGQKQEGKQGQEQGGRQKQKQEGKQKQEQEGKQNMEYTAAKATLWKTAPKENVCTELMVKIEESAKAIEYPEPNLLRGFLDCQGNSLEKESSDIQQNKTETISASTDPTLEPSNPAQQSILVENPLVAYNKEIESRAEEARSWSPVLDLSGEEFVYLCPFLVEGCKKVSSLKVSKKQQ